jgi:hypothetical protein
MRTPGLAGNDEPTGSEFLLCKEDGMLNRTLQLLIAVCIVTGTSRAADDPFAGRWKLDSSRSQLPADTMKVESGGANKYTFIFSEPNTETVAIDGTDQPGVFGTTLSVTAQGSRVWKVARKSKGRTLLTAIWTLSEEGGTLHDSYTEYRPDGSPFTVDYLYLRKAGDSGFAGIWQSTSEVYVSPYEIQIQPYQGDGFSLIDPVAGVNKSLKFDGTDYPNSGANAAPAIRCGNGLANHEPSIPRRQRAGAPAAEDYVRH